MIREPAFAKINLFLEVVGRLPNGYHHLQSLMVFADVGEWISLTQAPTDSFEISGPQSAGLDAKSQDNLVLKAMDVFRQAYPSEMTFDVRLHKVMPVSSGIGGGSADAAAMLRALNEMHGNPAAMQALLELAATLGADVPACLHSTPVVLDGAGQELTPAKTHGCMHGLLVNPRKGVSTPAVFNALAAPPITTIPALPNGAWAIESLRYRRNDLRQPAVALCPDIDEVLAFLAGLPAVSIAQMSGSGATCWALFDSAHAAAAGLEAVRQAKPGWWSAQAAFGT